MMPVSEDALTVEVHWARTVPVDVLVDALTRGERDRIGDRAAHWARDGIASSLVLARTAVGSWAGVTRLGELPVAAPLRDRRHGRPSASWRSVPDDAH